MKTATTTPASHLSFPLFLPALVLVAAGSVYLTFGDRGMLEVLRLSEQLQAIGASIETLNAENTGLIAEIDSLSNDDLYLEALVRDEYGLLRSDELLFKFSP